MERDPLDVAVEDKARADQELAKVRNVDARLKVALEVDARGLQQVDRVLGIHVVLQREGKVELPGMCAGGRVAVLVDERDAQLDYLEQVDVAAQRLKVVVGRVEEGADGARNDAGELCVHGDERVLCNQRADDAELALEVVLVHVLDLHLVVSGSGRQEGT